MNNPLDQIRGQVIIKGRGYSAKEIIRGLLEQGIAISESTEGLKIGFKLISPESEILGLGGGFDSSVCPLIDSISKINAQLNDLSSKLEVQQNKSQYANNFDFGPSKSSNSSFSPFKTSSPLTSFNEREKEKFFVNETNFMDSRKKCPSCGASLPTNAFFCNKCGNHVRSG
ncbi:MAG: zinc ribbon domain-containing protein [Candidatus Heimdallarchaeota archaeon]|nr:zinc ribbon domain-containing protein [Candidatus Heimdallarchaeota archaeon]